MKNSSRQCRQGQGCFSARMMTPSTMVASTMRSAADTLGPSCGAETRVKINDAPHSAESISS